MYVIRLYLLGGQRVRIETFAQPTIHFDRASRKFSSISFDGEDEDCDLAEDMISYINPDHVSLVQTWWEEDPEDQDD